MSNLRLVVLAVVAVALCSNVTAQQPPGPSSHSSALPISGALDATTLWSAEGPTYGDYLGSAIAHLPDLNGDGLAELLVGAPNRQPWGSGTEGHAFVFSGADGAVLRVHGGWNDGDRLGHSVAALPDLDGDGVADYGAGAIWALNLDAPHGPELPGRAAAWSGATGLPLLDVGGQGKWECFGAAMAGLGDIDHDGVADLLITAQFGGAPEGDATLAPGHVRLVSGATGATLVQVEGEFPGDRLGWSAVALPDLNGDALPDVAAAAWQWPAGAARGEVLILSGADGAVLTHFEGIEHSEAFGLALAALPDIDGDGLADLAIGAPGSQADRGRVAIVSPATGQTLATIAGLEPGERFGSSLAPIGDRTGDGVTELAVGAPKWALSSGRVLIVSPASGKFVGSVSGVLPSGRFGAALDAVPDLDGDGHDELAIGAPTAPSPKGYGQVFVVTLK
ncbi:MAG TPA: hypothetical protein VFY71_04035 [Planctomycetota bacterium]|nr:hypothetical protein [Planctomycetota bacterium]